MFRHCYEEKRAEKRLRYANNNKNHRGITSVPICKDNV